MSVPTAIVKGTGVLILRPGRSFRAQSRQFNLLFGEARGDFVSGVPEVCSANP
jgi:hypothetical protein